MAATHGDYGTGQMPLAGVVLCCTSIPPEQRTELAHIGAQMGATIKLDLTSDVTHLIVGNINSAKYRYVAKSREDVKVLVPQWLEALRTVWMEGDDVDVAALEKQYKLPTFYGLRICLTGFDNPDQRKLIQETVVQNGAEYHGDLTKNVTHLIAASPSGKKYEHAINWRMKIVTLEWYEQSCQRGMALDENLFHPTMAPEDRGKGAWDRRQSPPNQLGKRTREAEHDQPSSNPLKRKLRRSASSRMGGQSEALWAGITAAGLERRKNNEDDWTDNIDGAGLSNAHSPATVESNISTHLDENRVLDPTATKQPPTVSSRVSDGIFKRRAVLIFGFDSQKTTILRDHLVGNGATVLRNPEDISSLSTNDLRNGYLIVPHDVTTDLTSLPGGAGDLSLVTNWWVEQCLHKKRLVDPLERILCQPFTKLSVSGFNGLIVNSTGFTGIDLLQVTKVITLMGASYDDYLTAKTSVIVCNTSAPNEAKAKFARNNRIHVVNAEWLWDSIISGERQSYESYALTSKEQPARKQSQQRLAPFSEVPTAPLVEGDDARSRKKKEPTTKPGNNAASRGGRNGTRSLQLSLSTEPTPASMTEEAPGNQYQYDKQTHIAHDDSSTLHPLQDINPSVNSPRRPSTSSSTSNFRSTSSKSHSDTSHKPPSLPHNPRQPTSESMTIPPDNVASARPPSVAPELSKPDYSSIMSELLAHRKPSLSHSREASKNKPKRQLGRATSTRSNPSTADEAISRASSVVAEERDREWEATRLRKEGTGIDEYEPSQELGWDAPGAQEAREQMIRAMGGKVEDSIGVVQSIGVVRDVIAGEVVDDSLAGRNVRSGRRKRTEGTSA